MESAVLLGYGSIGRRHAQILSDHYARVAILDIDDRAREMAHSDFPKAPVARSLSELDKIGWRWDLTVGVIATWAPTHAALFADLAARGVLGVLCEKPLSHSVKSAVQMMEMAENLGITLGVNHHLRYSGFAPGLQALLHDLRIGDVSSIVIHGGAAGLVTNGIHYVDLASELLGHGPESVISTAVGDPINPRSDKLQFYGGTAVWSFGEGREATLSLSNRSSVAPSIWLYYRDAVVEVSQNLDVTIRGRVGSEVDEFPAVTRTGVTTEVIFKGGVPGVLSFEQRLAFLLEEIEAGKIEACPPQLALEALGACIGALSSGKLGRLVALPIDPLSDLGRSEWPIS